MLSVFRGSSDSIGSSDDLHIRLASAERSSSTGEPTQGNASSLSCYINLTSTVIGAGILGTPYALSKTGWILGLFFLIFCACLSFLGLYFMAACSRKVKFPSSYYSVCEASLPKFSGIIDLCVCFKGFGIATSYLIIIADSLPMAFEYFGGSGMITNRWVSLVFAYIVIVPLSYLPNLDSLKWSSVISGFMIIFLVLLVIMYSFQSDVSELDPCPSGDITDDTAECLTDQKLFIFNSGTMSAFPIFLFGYSCQQNTFGVVNELHNPTEQRTSVIFGAAIGTAFVFYILTAFCGYSTFGSDVESDILMTYPENSVVSICRLFVSFIVATHYPLQLHPSRRSALSLVQAYREEHEVSPIEYRRRFIIFSLLFNTVTFILAGLLDDLGLVLSILGSTMSSLVILILPGIFYYLLHRDEDQGKTFSMTNLSLGFFGLGWIVLVVSLFFTIYEA